MTHATRLALTIAAFCILVASSIGINFFMTRHAIDSASAAHQIALANRQYQLALCDAGNVARAQQIQLWQYIVKISPAKTPQEQQKTADFEAYLLTVFAPRDCNHL